MEECSRLSKCFQIFLETLALTLTMEMTMKSHQMNIVKGTKTTLSDAAMHLDRSLRVTSQKIKYFYDVSLGDN